MKSYYAVLSKSYAIVRSIRMLLFGIIGIVMLGSCSKNDTPVNAITPKPLKIFVMSDPHYYDLTLGSSGKAFDSYVASDRKLIKESSAIFDAAIEQIIIEKPDIVLISGDLTKDGEKASHLKVAAQLERLNSLGIKVYVVPGNHDINNPGASAYSGDIATSTENISPADFKTIYNKCGYENAIYKDPNSLSYVAKLNDTIWLFAIDANLYDLNTSTYMLSSGEIADDTYSWLKDKLAEAKRLNKIAIGMMHHGLTEHFAGQSETFSAYVINDWQTKSKELAAAGLRMVFTGHFHANDITGIDNSAGGISLDVETGSLVTYPCAYRIIEISDTFVATFKSARITAIKAPIPGDYAFQTYAKNSVEKAINDNTESQLISQFGFTEEQAKTFKPFATALLTPAVIAHFSGDETPDPSTISTLQSLKTGGNDKMAKGATYMISVWTDLAPADLNIKYDLIKGLIIK